jgi:hypothetical protein
MKELGCWITLVFVVLVATLSIEATAQEATVLSGEDLTRVVPTGFYFEGRSGPTQMRNAAAVRFGPKRYVIAALVDTAGYAADVQARYEGFLITDSAIAVGGKELPAGAYGFGFSKDDKLNISDLGGNPVMSIGTAKDSALRNPRPLTIVKGNEGIRLYRGRSYVTLAAK